jgi:S-adenosyl-L-methionine hydrolase (adenosine-forming)
MAKPPIITLLTDFGAADHYVAAMKGVILGICPDARLVDISHEVRAYGIAEAAFVLGQAYWCFPSGTNHLVVVDPGVGSTRRPLVVEADGHRFVAPDNGVLTFPMHRDGGYQAREIGAARYFRKPVSRTFHGRDIFAPIAARLAGGLAIAKIGRLVSDPVLLGLTPPVEVKAGLWSGRILYKDRFGNLVTSFRPDDVPEVTRKPFEMSVGEVSTSSYRVRYSDAPDGEAFVIQGSSGYLEISINQGDAGARAGVGIGAAVTLHFR